MRSYKDSKRILIKAHLKYYLKHASDFWALKAIALKPWWYISDDIKNCEPAVLNGAILKMMWLLSSEKNTLPVIPPTAPSGSVASVPFTLRLHAGESVTVEAVPMLKRWTA